MDSLYRTLDASHVGIFESPTGTGKSLSIICGAMQWLRDKQCISIDDILRDLDSHSDAAPAPPDDEPAWVAAFARQQKIDQAQAVRSARLRRREARQQRLKDIRDQEIAESTRPTFKRKAETAAAADAQVDSHSDFLVDEYVSDHESTADPDTSAKRRTARFLKSLEAAADTADDELDASLDDPDDGPDHPQIIYCARTHSQIAQFVNEIKKTAFADARCVTLGSRKNMCINDSVLRLQSVSKINDRCLEMQKSSSTKDKEEKLSGCPYYLQDKRQMLLFDDTIHASIRDIEEIVRIGRKKATCPYYGTRHTAKSSEIICLPYNLLLQRSVRESIGLRLKNNVVILDEAHNIVETVNSIHSHHITLAQIQACIRHTTAYYERYKRRLAGKNVVYIKQIMVLLTAFERVLSASQQQPGAADKPPGRPSDGKSGAQGTVLTVSEFVDRAGVDHFNLFKILKYLDTSRLPQKLLGFAVKEVAKRDAEQGTSDRETMQTSVSPLAFLQAFISSLTDPDINGRIVLSHGTNPLQSAIKYLLLNPADCFAPIVREAQSVVFAGGTMSPIRDFVAQLLPDIQPDNLDVFSCGHVVPSTSLLPMCVSRGPTGIEFDFSHEKRFDERMIDEAGNAIANYCNIVPGGVIAFFVSYSYLETVVKRWAAAGILDRIRRKKKVFTEPTSVGAVDRILKEYADTIASSMPSCGRSTTTISPTAASARLGTQASLTGALMLAVVSGKLSEGINFADDMGRAVIMVGIPFANITSVELQERMRFFDQKARSQAAHASRGMTGTEYYENLCMRAVNQSIGRVIRHIGDFAAIVLMDARFKRERIAAKLPAWIRDCGVQSPDAFGPTVAAMSKFFASRRQASV